MERVFIIWDPRDGAVRTDDDGNIISDGLIGRVGGDNVYVRVYAEYPPGTPMLVNGEPALEVGQFARADFRLSGSHGRYHVYRVA